MQYFDRNTFSTIPNYELYNEFENNSEYTNINSVPCYPQNSSSSNPCINIIIFTPQTNLMNNSFFGNYQQTQNQMIPNYSYFTPYQMPTIQQPQYFQQPNYTNSIFQSTYKSPSSKKNKKSKQKSHRRKEAKKSIEKTSKHQKKSTKQKEDGLKIQTFEYKPGNDFNGIIQYLRQQAGENTNDIGVKATSSSNMEGDLPSNLLLKPSFEKGFRNIKVFRAKANEKDFWVCFDFVNM